MLVLSRLREQTIMIGDGVEITVVDIKGEKVRLGISAPREIQVHRKEVYDAIRRENAAASEGVAADDLTRAAQRLPRLNRDGGDGRLRQPTIAPRTAGRSLSA